MNTLIRLILAVIIFVPVSAVADSQVTFFGKFDGDLESVNTSQPGVGIASTRIRMTSNASRLGVRGSKDIGSDLQVIWQAASRINLNSTETSNGGGMFTLFGNTRAGMKGNFGTLFMGIWDTPFRQAYDKIDQHDNTHIASPIALLGSIGNGIGGASTLPTVSGLPAAVSGDTVSTTSFHRRQKSSLQYWSPVINQFQVKIAYSVDDPSTRTAAVNPGLFSVSVAYDHEQVYFAMAYERHQDMKIQTTPSVTNLNGIDTGVRLIGGYMIDSNQLGIVLEQLNYTTRGFAGTSRNAISLSDSYRFGVNSIGVIYTKTGSLSGTANTGADQVSLRYGYNFYENTEFYGQYTAIDNQANGSYNFGDGAVATSYGARISGLGVGMAYAF